MQIVSHTKESTSSATTASATIPVVSGNWEIVSLSIANNSGDKAAAVVPLISTGWVQFEPEDRGGNWDSPKLAQGYATTYVQMVMQGTRVIQGPGNIKSYMDHQNTIGAFKHTMCVVMRRLVP